MIISKNQNTITLDDVTELVAKDDHRCIRCHFEHGTYECLSAPCYETERSDERNVIFITKDSANVQ